MTTEEKSKELIEKWRVLAKDKNEKGNLIRAASRVGCFGECATREMETAEDRFVNWSSALYNCAKELDDLIKGIPPEKEN